MTQKSITIKASLDARQAAYFVQTAGKFESEILITADGKDEAAAVEELAAVLA